VPGGSADREVDRFGKRLGMPGTFLQGIQVLGLQTNKQVTCQDQGAGRGSAIVRGQDDETGGVSAGSRAFSKVSRMLRNVKNIFTAKSSEVSLSKQTSTQYSQDPYRLTSNLGLTNPMACWLAGHSLPRPANKMGPRT